MFELESDLQVSQLEPTAYKKKKAKPANIKIWLQLSGYISNLHDFSWFYIPQLKVL